jgi:molybdenum cofactor cytidylyltransferase
MPDPETIPPIRPDPGATKAERIGCIVLAAGASTRMGEPKQLLAISGQTLLARAVEAALAAPVWPVIVVVGANAERIRPTLARFPVLVVENSSWPEGMASSIRAGVTALRQFARSLDGAAIILCDQPALSSGTIQRLIAEQKRTGLGIAAAHYLGRRAAPALFMREHFDTLISLTGEAGARILLNGDPTLVAAVEMPELAVDLDTPADVAAWKPA